MNSGEDESEPVKVNTNVKLTKTGSEDEEENMQQSEVADVSENKEEMFSFVDSISSNRATYNYHEGSDTYARLDS